MGIRMVRWGCWVALCLQVAVAQRASQAVPPLPKLVVGIVVDQMRYDLLTRYARHYQGGFHRLVGQGYSFQQMHYNFMPTYTGPGHATIYAGAPPAVNGIIANDWYSREWGRMLYCVTDTTTPSVGGSAESGNMSPRNLLVGNLSTMLLKASPQSKVLALALKDRGAILPAGPAPAQAYWFDRRTGNWVTSTYYRRDLPAWVERFNGRNLPDSLLTLGWQPMLPLSAYRESDPDSMPGEARPFTDRRNTLPYRLTKTRNGYQELLTSPHGNTLTTAFALAALAGEGLGTDEATDFLLISYSSTDYIGHAFGPNSVETQDTYLRLDRELADLLAALERQAGRGNVLVFLTADHGVANTPEHARAHQQPGGRFAAAAFEAALDSHLAAKFLPPVPLRKQLEVKANPQLVQAYTNQQVYLNLARLAQAKVARADAEAEVAAFARNWPNVAQVITRSEILAGQSPIPAIARGWHPERSGDVVVVYEPGWFDQYGTEQVGTTHGSHYDYDTHVPFLLWGWRVPKGRSTKRVDITDLAPTIARHLGISAPPTATGNALELK